MKRGESIRLIVSIFVVLALAVFPRLSIAGSLEPTPDAVDPSGNPVPTMKTLNEIPPTWSQKLRADDGPNGDSCNSSRFKCVLDGEAVLDKETGLVWERAPRTYTGNWLAAQWECWAHNTAARFGWRLPTISELNSLMEYCPDRWFDQLLPCGHPFINVADHEHHYWSATTWFFDSNEAITWSQTVGHGPVTKTLERNYWCVRGGIVSSFVSD